MSNPDSQAAPRAPLDPIRLAFIDVRVAELRVLAARTARDYWRARSAGAWARLRLPLDPDHPSRRAR
jgi:hypothetical protein